MTLSEQLIIMSCGRNTTPKKGIHGAAGRLSVEDLPSPRSPGDKNALWNLLNNSLIADQQGTMHAVQTMSPGLAVRKIGLLIETRRFEECSVLLKKMSRETIQEVVPEIPIQGLLANVPESLSVVEALYTLLYEADIRDFPGDFLQPDVVVRQIIKWFAKCGDPECGPTTQRVRQNSTSSQTSLTSRHSLHLEHHHNFCKTILHIIQLVDPNVRQKLERRRMTIDNVLENLAVHGLVEISGGGFMNLHDALNIEFKKTVSQYKLAIQRLDELSLSHKVAAPATVSKGPAPSSVGHQRLINVSQTDVQTRLIKNKTLLDTVEPVLTNAFLRNLLENLENRIEYDKDTLFYHSELRRDMCLDAPPGGVSISQTFLKFSDAYGKVLELLNNISTRTDEADGCDLPGHDDGYRYRNLSVTSNTLTRGEAGRNKKSRKEITSGNTASTTQTTPASFNNGSSHLIPPPNMTSNSTTVAPSSVLSPREVQSLRNEVKQLKTDLVKAKQYINQQEEREKSLKDRLSEQARRQFDKGTKFEDLSLGTNRPTQLSLSYSYLYSQTRVDALDALDGLAELIDLDGLKGKLIFSVVVLSFRCAETTLANLKSKVSDLLYLPSYRSNHASHDPVIEEMEDTISTYLRKTVERYDTMTIMEEVSNQIYATLYDYPSLKICDGLTHYMEECVSLAWKCVVQNPPITIDFDSTDFDSFKHTRFHSSNPESSDIMACIWPCLVDAKTGECLHKGVVIT